MKLLKSIALFIILVCNANPSFAVDQSGAIDEAICKTEITKTISTDSSSSTILDTSKCSNAIYLDNLPNKLMFMIFGKNYADSLEFALNTKFINTNFTNDEVKIELKNSVTKIPDILTKFTTLIFTVFSSIISILIGYKLINYLQSNKDQPLAKKGDITRISMSFVLTLPVVGVNIIQMIYLFFVAISIYFANYIYSVSNFSLSQKIFKDEMNKTDSVEKTFKYEIFNGTIENSITNNVSSYVCDKKNRELLIDNSTENRKIKTNVESSNIYKCLNDFNNYNLNPNLLMESERERNMPFKLVQTQICMISEGLSTGFDEDYCGKFGTTEQEYESVKKTHGVTSEIYQQKMIDLAEKVHEIECKSSSQFGNDIAIKPFNCVRTGQNSKYLYHAVDDQDILATIDRIDDYKDSQQYKTDLKSLSDSLAQVHDFSHNYTNIKRAIHENEASLSVGGKNKVDEIYNNLSFGFLFANSFLLKHNTYRKEVDVYSNSIVNIFNFQTNVPNGTVKTAFSQVKYNINEDNSNSKSQSKSNSSIDLFGLNNILNSRTIFSCYNSNGIERDEKCGRLSLNPLNDISDFGNKLLSVSIPFKVVTSLSLFINNQSHAELRREENNLKRQGLSDDQVKHKAKQNLQKINSKSKFLALTKGLLGKYSDFSGSFFGIISIFDGLANVIIFIGLLFVYVIPSIHIFIFLSLVFGWIWIIIKSSFVLPLICVQLATDSKNDEDTFGGDTSMYDIMFTTLMYPTIILISCFGSFIMMHVGLGLLDSTFGLVFQKIMSNASNGLVVSIFTEFMGLISYATITLLIVVKSALSMYSVVRYCVDFFGLETIENAGLFDPLKKVVNGVLFTKF
ncbi:hypothetical protein [Shewanella baltica]|uniref:hypothetical protein n=1 Tax=Shewanella baltica TaxID=62322 RepID=UPI003D7BB522